MRNRRNGRRSGTNGGGERQKTERHIWKWLNQLSLIGLYQKCFYTIFLLLSFLCVCKKLPRSKSGLFRKRYDI